jgi:F-type H+-transporting ATPase subunit b
MIIDATFWVAVSFFIFLGVLIYFKIPQKIVSTLNDNINTIKTEVDDAELLKDESKNIFSEYEKKISNAKAEVKQIFDTATDDADHNVLKTNEEFYVQMENRKKNTEDRIKQMKNQALKDIKNASVKIAIQTVEVLLKNSLDKNKLNKIFTSSVEETKSALKSKST